MLSSVDFSKCMFDYEQLEGKTLKIHTQKSEEGVLTFAVDVEDGKVYVLKYKQFHKQVQRELQ